MAVTMNQGLLSVDEALGRLLAGAAPVADFPTTLPTAGNIPLIVTDSIPVKQAKITLS